MSDPIRERDGSISGETSEDSRCPRCHVYVRAATTARGVELLLDPDPHPDGNVLEVQTPDGWVARVLSGSDARPEHVPMYLRHLCRRRGRRARRIIADDSPPPAPRPAETREPPPPRCEVCGHRLDRALAASGGEDGRSHPSCREAPLPVGSQP